MASNPYLEGNYAPVREELTVTDLPVSGHIPDHLDGRYLRIGPNPIGADPATYHWFLGDGMVHGVRLRDGRAQWYRNRFVRSGETARRLGEAAPPGRPHAGLDLSPNTNVIGHAGQTIALIEAGPRPIALSDELETVGRCDFDGTLAGGYTAHPHVDPETGELHALSYFWGWGNRVRYTVTGVDGRVRRSVDIPVTGSPMIHDFSLTDRYVVIYDLPVTFDVRRAGRGAPAPIRPMAIATLSTIVGRLPIPERLAAMMIRSSGQSAPYSADSFPYSWNPRYPARVGLLPREGTAADVRWFDVEPCYVFHPLNAFDADDGSVVLDVVRHPKVFATEFRGPAEGPPTLDRWTVDLAAGKVREERLDDRSQEFPRIDERRTGRRHRYGYAVGFAAGDDGDQIIKHDLAGGGSQTRRFGPGWQLSEFVFVPNRPDADEADGVLMGYAYDPACDRSQLALLDAATLESVATVQLPARVPQGFHGNWLPTQA